MGQGDEQLTSIPKPKSWVGLCRGQCAIGSRSGPAVLGAVAVGTSASHSACASVSSTWGQR